MDTDQPSQSAPTPDPFTGIPASDKRRTMYFVIVLVLAWFLLAYLLIPALWKGYIHFRPSYANIPEITFTSDGHPGDPLNVSLIGTKEQVEAIFKSAGWFPADPLGLRSDLRIGVDTVLEAAIRARAGQPLVPTRPGRQAPQGGTGIREARRQRPEKTQPRPFLAD